MAGLIAATTSGIKSSKEVVLTSNQDLTEMSTMLKLFSEIPRCAAIIAVHLGNLFSCKKLKYEDIEDIVLVASGQEGNCKFLDDTESDSKTAKTTAYNLIESAAIDNVADIESISENHDSILKPPGIKINEETYDYFPTLESAQDVKSVSRERQEKALIVLIKAFQCSPSGLLLLAQANFKPEPGRYFNGIARTINQEKFANAFSSFLTSNGIQPDRAQRIIEVFNSKMNVVVINNDQLVCAFKDESAKTVSGEIIGLGILFDYKNCNGFIKKYANSITPKVENQRKSYNSAIVIFFQDIWELTDMKIRQLNSYLFSDNNKIKLDSIDEGEGASLVEPPDSTGNGAVYRLDLSTD